MELLDEVAVVSVLLPGEDLSNRSVLMFIAMLEDVVASVFSEVNVAG